MKTNRKEETRTLRALNDEMLSTVTGGTRSQLLSALARMNNDAVAAFIDGFLNTAPVK